MKSLGVPGLSALVVLVLGCGACGGMNFGGIGGLTGGGTYNPPSAGNVGLSFSWTVEGDRTVRFHCYPTNSGGGPGLLQYSWDFDGDGAWDRYLYSPDASWTYPEGGVYQVRVRISRLGWSGDTSGQIPVRVPTAVPGQLVPWGADQYPYGMVTAAPLDVGILSAALGVSHGVAVGPDGSLRAWGDDRDGAVSLTPGGTGHEKVAAGEQFSVALDDGGMLTAWGRNDRGQVSGVPGGTNFVDVAAGHAHGVALRTDGSLVSWGDDSGLAVSGTPLGTGFVAVYAGRGCSAAVRPDGSLEVWGPDGPGGLVSLAPTGGGYDKVALGLRTAYALRWDGGLESWGYDGEGRVSGTPGGTGFLDVGVHCALRADGSIVEWPAAAPARGQSGAPTATGFSTLIATQYDTTFGVL